MTNPTLTATPVWRLARGASTSKARHLRRRISPRRDGFHRHPRRRLAGGAGAGQRGEPERQCLRRRLQPPDFSKGMPPTSWSPTADRWESRSGGRPGRPRRSATGTAQRQGTARRPRRRPLGPADYLQPHSLNRNSSFAASSHSSASRRALTTLLRPSDTAFVTTFMLWVRQQLAQFRHLVSQGG